MIFARFHRGKEREKERGRYRASERGKETEREREEERERGGRDKRDPLESPLEHSAAICVTFGQLSHVCIRATHTYIAGSEHNNNNNDNATQSAVLDSMRVPAARGKCPARTWKNWRRWDGEFVASCRTLALKRHRRTVNFSSDDYGPRSLSRLIGIRVLSHVNSGLLFSSRYLSEHGYSAATDSGNIVDMQKIVKRLLDVRIKRADNVQNIT